MQSSDGDITTNDKCHIILVDALNKLDIVYHNWCIHYVYTHYTFTMRWIFSHLSFTIEAKDLKADAWSAPSLDFMQMSEEVEPCSSPPIIQLTLCQNTQQSGFARVHITQDSDPQIQELQGKHKA